MFHIRFTPDDISGYTFDFLDCYTSYIVAYEDKKKDGSPCPPHYHILIDTDYGEKHVRDDVKASLKIPQSGRGKNNKYYAFYKDWKDASYICKWDNIVKSKGLTEKQVLDLALEGKKYLRLVKDLNVVAPKKEKKVSYQQAVIASAAAEWYKYKKETYSKDPGTNVDDLDKSMVVQFVMKAMREESKGINAYMVKDLAYAILYDDLDYRDWVVKKVMDVFAK